MPEYIDDREIREAFVTLRDDARADIQPPGSGAAHRTVVRRRRLRAGLAAVGLVLVVAAGFAALGPYGHRWPTPATDPTRSPDQLTRQAYAALGMVTDPTHVDPRSALGSPVTSARQTHEFGTEKSLPAGDYTLRSVCIGEGLLHLSWQNPGGSGSFDVPCTEGADNGVPRSATTTLTVAGKISIAVAADSRAVGRSAYAITITDPRIVLATAALGPTTGSEVLSGGWDVDSVVLGGESVAGTMALGRYVLQIACAGTGAIRATISDEATQSHSYELTCSEQGEPLRMTDYLGEEIIITRSDQALRVTAERIAGTTILGIAYRVVRT